MNLNKLNQERIRIIDVYGGGTISPYTLGVILKDMSEIFAKMPNAFIQTIDSEYQATIDDTISAFLKSSARLLENLESYLKAVEHITDEMYEKYESAAKVNREIREKIAQFPDIDIKFDIHKVERLLEIVERFKGISDDDMQRFARIVGMMGGEK